MTSLDDLLPEPPPALGPEVRDTALPASAIARMVADAATGHPRRSLIEACVLLWHDRLDEAHRIVQASEGEHWADTLHAIMHRREPDEDNSRYWWRRVGRHPLAGELGREAQRLGLPGLASADGLLLPAAMATACCRRTLPEPALRSLQACELRWLARSLLAS
jgi:hypothetical protein